MPDERQHREPHEDKSGQEVPDELTQRLLELAQDGSAEEIQRLEDQYLQEAQDFFRQSMGRIKGQMQSDSAQLESLMQLIRDRLTRRCLTQKRAREA